MFTGKNQINISPWPLLRFSRKKELIYLQDRQSDVIIFSFPAHNLTEKPDGNPLISGSWGPAPNGFLTVSPPDFISVEFREKFYIENLKSKIIVSGESLVQEWGEFEVEQMGRVRFALGSPSAPANFPDKAAWDRELLIHAGRPFETLTKGCIRMDNSDVESLAVEWIRWFRLGVELKTILIED